MQNFARPNLGSLIRRSPGWSLTLASVLPCMRSVLGILIRKFKVLHSRSTLSPCYFAEPCACFRSASQLTEKQHETFSKQSHHNKQSQLYGAPIIRLQYIERAIPLLLGAASVEGQQKASVGDAECTLTPPCLGSARPTRRYITASKGNS